MIRWIALALALAFVPISASAQSTNQLVTGATMASLISGGAFSNTGSCSFSGDLIVTRAVFVSCIHNNGSCGGSGDYVMTYGDMVTCGISPSSYTHETLTCNGYSLTNPASHTCNGSTSVSISNATYPITASPGAQTICTYNVVVNGSSVIGTNGGAGGSSYTGGATGAISVQVGSTPGHSCPNSNITVGYYH